MYRNKEWLKQKYFQEKLLMREIADICGVQTDTISRWFKKFGLKSRSMSECHKGKWNGRYKGHKTIKRGKRGKGGSYVLLNINGKRYREHRIIMEKVLRRKLLFQETVHHKDGNSLNNKPSNLQLFQTRSAHQRYEDTLNYFAKQILFGKIKPTNRKELLSLFNNLLSKDE